MRLPWRLDTYQRQGYLPLTHRGARSGFVHPKAIGMRLRVPERLFRTRNNNISVLHRYLSNSSSVGSDGSGCLCEVLAGRGVKDSTGGVD